jgi:ABC-type multidrug transport system ATPase subunit
MAARRRRRFCRTSRSKFRRGKTIAIVGRSGSGKTTLAKCLAGLLEPTEGTIQFDRLDLKTLNYRDLRGRSGSCSRTRTCSPTASDATSLWRRRADMTRVTWAAQAASAQEFIDRLPFGYDTRIGETGIALSGGQKQRIAIARALYHKPPILVFDEATSSLDTESERAVQENIDALLRGRTSFVIAHRLSTVRNADKIIVLERGRLVEQGTHDELMRRQGLYTILRASSWGRLTMTGSESPAPFLDADPPPWAVRALATHSACCSSLSASSRCSSCGCPETVSATFTLRPVRGTDPVRTLHDGIVAKVNVEDAQTVAAGTVLFVIASEPVGDRMAERQTVDARLSGGRTRVDNERQRYENQRRADTQEQGRLQQHLANLERS